jgi:hypothetical protein
MIGNLPTLATATGALVLGAILLQNFFRFMPQRRPIRVRSEHRRR